MRNNKKNTSDVKGDFYQNLIHELETYCPISTTSYSVKYQISLAPQKVRKWLTNPNEITIKLHKKCGYYENLDFNTRHILSQIFLSRKIIQNTTTTQ